MDKKNLQPKQKAPVVRPTTITPPQLSEEQLTGGMTGQEGLHPFGAGSGTYGFARIFCSFDGDYGE